MTTTVIVKARAWGANVTKTKVVEGEVGHVTTGEEEVELTAHQDQTFHLEEGETLTVKSLKPKPNDETAEVEVPAPDWGDLPSED